MNLIERLYLAAMVTIGDFLDDERGDTNFISIIIILGIVVLLAGVFMGFRDTIVAQVQGIVNGFTIN